MHTTPLDSGSGSISPKSEPGYISLFRNLRRFLHFVGPGWMVSVGYMDPGNWATDMEGGSKYGYSLLFVLFGANIMAIVLQTLTVRLGVVTGLDLAQACRAHCPRWANLILYVLCELAIIACDVAEVIGSAIAMDLLFGIPLWIGCLITLADVLLIMGLISLAGRWASRGHAKSLAPTRILEAFVIALVAGVAICFLVLLGKVHAPIGPVMKGFLPSTDILSSADRLWVSLGIIGATVMPHNLYLHSHTVKARAFYFDVPTEAEEEVDLRQSAHSASASSSPSSVGIHSLNAEGMEEGVGGRVSTPPPASGKYVLSGEDDRPSPRYTEARLLHPIDRDAQPILGDRSSTLQSSRQETLYSLPSSSTTPPHPSSASVSASAEGKRGLAHRLASRLGRPWQGDRRGREALATSPPSSLPASRAASPTRSHHIGEEVHERHSLLRRAFGRIIYSARTEGEKEPEMYRRDDENIPWTIGLSVLDMALALCIALFVNAAILIVAGTVFFGVDEAQSADLFDAYTLLRSLLGQAAATVFAIALLLSGLSATVTATLAGQVVMEGFLGLGMKPWVRRFLSRGLAVVPATIIAASSGRKGLADLLVGSQVALSLQLSFAVVPLVYFTSSRRIMQAHGGEVQGREEKRRAARALLADVPPASESESGSSSGSGSGSGPGSGSAFDVDGEGEGDVREAILVKSPRADWANPRWLIVISSIVTVIIVFLNAFLLVQTARGETSF